MLPYFRLYAAELLADENTAAFNVAELGAWLRLVCSCWVNGSIPDDPKRLAGLMHTSEEAGAELWLSISDRFAPHPTQEGRLVSRRLERERTEATEAREARVRGGLESARVRRERTGSAQPEREVSRKVSSKSARTHPASQPASPASPHLTSPASQPEARARGKRLRATCRSSAGTRRPAGRVEGTALRGTADESLRRWKRVRGARVLPESTRLGRRGHVAHRLPRLRKTLEDWHTLEPRLVRSRGSNVCQSLRRPTELLHDPRPGSAGGSEGRRTAACGRVETEREIRAPSCTPATSRVQGRRV